MIYAYNAHKGDCLFLALICNYLKIDLILHNSSQLSFLKSLGFKNLSIIKNPSQFDYIFYSRRDEFFKRNFYLKKKIFYNLDRDSNLIISLLESLNLKINNHDFINSVKVFIDSNKYNFVKYNNLQSRNLLKLIPFSGFHKINIFKYFFFLNLYLVNYKKLDFFIDNHLFIINGFLKKDMIVFFRDTKIKNKLIDIFNIYENYNISKKRLFFFDLISFKKTNI